jgi:hypothetical protein
MLLDDVVRKIKTYIHLEDQPERQDPDDPDAPFAMVGARIKPRPPLGHSSIAVQPER